MKRILVKGAPGFIGSYLIKRLVEKGNEVTAVDNLERGKIDFIKNEIPKMSFVNTDLTDYEKVKNLFNPNMGLLFHYSLRKPSSNFWENTKNNYL